MTKVEAVVIRERIETVIDAVEEETGHVGVTVIEAVGHGRQRGVTHEDRGRVFESRFLPKAMLIFVVDDHRVDAVVKAIAAAAVSEAGVAIVPLSAFAEQDPPRHLVRLCFGKKDETIEAGVAAMARAKELLA